MKTSLIRDARPHSQQHHRIVHPVGASIQVNGLDVRIHDVRGEHVLLDVDLAALYGVSTGALMQAVRRNRQRFPADFVLVLTNQEVARLRSQTVIAKPEGRGGRRTAPYAFTEQGVAMLSSVLRSKTAVAANVEIMRTFVRLRRASVLSQQLTSLIADLARRVGSHDEAIKGLVATIRRLVDPPTAQPPKRRPIGFVPID